MNKIITIISICFITIFFSGCTAKLAQKSLIPPAPKVDKMNHMLTIEKQYEIQKKYFEYQDNLVTGIFTLAKNGMQKSKYNRDLKAQDVDLSHEKVYDCKISEMFGKFPDKYFHSMFVISNKRQVNKDISVALNKNNVNEFIVYKDAAIYDHKDGGYGFAIVDLSKLDLDNVIAIRYRCKKVKNNIFKSDIHKPTYE